LATEIVVVGIYKLLFSFINVSSIRCRVYLITGHGFIFTYNAFWSGVDWVKDSTGAQSTALEMRGNGIFNFYHRAAVVGTWTTWDNQAVLNIVSGLEELRWVGSTVTLNGATGAISGPGSITTYAAIAARYNSGDIAGAGFNYRKDFPSAPSTVTYTVHASTNITGPTITTVNNTVRGAGANGTVTANGVASFYCTVTAS
jgi:hypothetical protein